VITSRLWGIVELFFQLEEVWLRSRKKSRIEEALDEFISKTKQDIIDWRDLSTKELAAFYAKLSLEMPEIKVPSRVCLWFKKRNPFAGAFTRLYVQRVWKRWYLYLWNPLKWVEVWLFECIHGFRFLLHLLGKELEKKPASLYNLTHK
jgi:hypothetical protein